MYIHRSNFSQKWDPFLPLVLFTQQSVLNILVQFYRVYGPCTYLDLHRLFLLNWTILINEHYSRHKWRVCPVLCQMDVQTGCSTCLGILRVRRCEGWRRSCGKIFSKGKESICASLSLQWSFVHKLISMHWYGFKRGALTSSQAAGAATPATCRLASLPWWVWQLPDILCATRRPLVTPEGLTEGDLPLGGHLVTRDTFGHLIRGRVCTFGA